MRNVLKKPIIIVSVCINNIFGKIFGEEIIALTIFPFIFIKDEDIPIDILNHEYIHYEQFKETLIIGFPIIVFINLVINLIRFKDRNIAYRNLLFEKEAYQHMEDENYIKNRKHFAWIRNL